MRPWTCQESSVIGRVLGAMAKSKQGFFENFVGYEKDF